MHIGGEQGRVKNDYKDLSVNKLENYSAMNTSKGISLGKEQVWYKASFIKYPLNIHITPHPFVGSGNTAVNENSCLQRVYILEEEADNR